MPHSTARLAFGFVQQQSSARERPNQLLLDALPPVQKIVNALEDRYCVFNLFVAASATLLAATKPRKESTQRVGCRTKHPVVRVHTHRCLMNSKRKRLEPLTHDFCGVEEFELKVSTSSEQAGRDEARTCSSLNPGFFVLKKLIKGSS